MIKSKKRRGVYYSSRMIEDLLEATTDSSEYDKVKPIYSLWISLIQNSKLKNSVVKYRLLSNDYQGIYDKEGKVSYINMFKIFLDCEYYKNKPNDLTPDIIKLIYGLFNNDKSLLKDLEVKYSKVDEERMNDMVKEKSLIYEDGFADGETKGLIRGFTKGYISKDAVVELLDITDEKFEALVKEYSEKNN